MRRPDRWEKALLVITYDEHGGFFDHVRPIDLGTEAQPGSAYEPFLTTGVRVPAFIVSPFVERGTVFSEPLDHTSLLGLLADRFTPGEAYSEAVARRSQLLSRLANALTLAEPRADFPAPPPRGPSVPSLPSEAVDASARAEGAESNAGAFREAFVTTVENHPIAAVELLPSGAHLIESP